MAIAEVETYQGQGVEVPGVDGHPASRLELRFTGVAQLRAGIEDDVALLAAVRLGQPVRLIAYGFCSSKGFSLLRSKGSDDVVTFSVALKVETVEAVEAAELV